MNSIALNCWSWQWGSTLGFELPQNHDSIVLEHDIKNIRSAVVPEAEPVDQMYFQTAMFLFIDLMLLISPKAVFPEKET